MSAVDEIAAYLAHLKTGGNRIDQIIFDELPNGEEMNATDELRRLLDERGVEYEGNKDVTRFFGYDGFEVVMQEDIDGKLDCLTPLYLTPEQAIEATLGSDLEAENAKLRELVKDLLNAWDDMQREVVTGPTFDDCERRAYKMGIEVDA